MIPVELPEAIWKVTLRPPVVRTFPLASLAVKIMEVLDPDASVLDPTTELERESETGPGKTVTGGAAERIDDPLTFTTIEVAVPAVTPVKVEE